MKRYTKIIYISITLFVLFTALVIAWAYPKSEPHRMNPKYLTAHYRGFDISSPSILGKQYFMFTAGDGTNGRAETMYSQPGYNKQRGYYKNGTLKVVADIYVELLKWDGQPYPDEHLVRDGKYFKPDGTLASSITNGTGKQIFYNEQGQPTWMLVLKDYKRVECKMWYQGELTSHAVYLKDGTEKYLFSKSRQSSAESPEKQE